MKKLTSIVVAFLLVLSVIPAMADDQTDSKVVEDSKAVDQATVSFQAFSKLSTTERQSLAPLTETELASVEGGDWFVCLCCCHIAKPASVSADNSVNTVDVNLSNINIPNITNTN